MQPRTGIRSLMLLCSFRECSRKDSSLGDLSSQGHVTALKPQFLLGEGEVQGGTEVGTVEGPGDVRIWVLERREHCEELRLQMEKMAIE